MAITLNTVFAGPDTKIVDVIASADADTTATIPHGLGAVPQEFTLTWLVLSATLSLWQVTAADATNLTLTKSTAVGSGNAGPQVKCIMKRPHSIGR